MAKACLFLGGVLALAALVWMILLPTVVEHELRAVTGFDVRVAVLAANPFTGRVVVRGLVASNPPGYPRPDFVEMRELHADVNVFSWVLSGRVVVSSLDVDIGRVVLMRRHDGKTNAGDFMAAFKRGGQAAEAAPPAPGKPAGYLVKSLRLRLEQLVVADYSGTNPEERTYDLRIDQTYANISDPKQLLVPGVVRSLRGFLQNHDAARLLPGDFGSALASAVGDAALIKDEVKETGKKAGKLFKGLLQKLEQ
jgi:hypothetical protein